MIFLLTTLLATAELPPLDCKPVLMTEHEGYVTVMMPTEFWLFINRLLDMFIEIQ